MSRFEKFLISIGFEAYTYNAKKQTLEKGYQNISTCANLDNRYKHPNSEKIYTIGFTEHDKAHVFNKLNFEIIASEFYYINDFIDWCLDNINHNILAEWLISGKKLEINLNEHTQRIIE
jgi:hypothetical protein